MVSNSSSPPWGNTDIAHADILDQVGVQVASLVDLLQQAVHHEIEVGILEATLFALQYRYYKQDVAWVDHDEYDSNTPW